MSVSSNLGVVHTCLISSTYSISCTALQMEKKPALFINWGKQIFCIDQSTFQKSNRASKRRGGGGVVENFAAM